MDAGRINRQVVLAARPSGAVQLSNFSVRTAAVPQIGEGELLIRAKYLSADPYMRGRMNDRPSYIEPFRLGSPISGGVVGTVEESRSPAFAVGDIVQGMLDWADFSAAPANALTKVSFPEVPCSTALGVLGMPGITAYFSFLEVGRPKKGDTVVVSAAAGAVGSIVGQIAKIHGCHVVGIAGSDEKVRYVTQELGFDAAVNYKNVRYRDELRSACPNGVDIYFDNVGGDITDSVLQLINKRARIVLCGQISGYNQQSPDMGPRNWWQLLTKSARAEGFLVFDYMDRASEALNQLSVWVREGRIRYREHVVDGLENAPKAFLGLFTGDNIGKQIVRV